jgi:hypothetical protein
MAEIDARLAVLNKLDRQYMEQLAKCWHYSGIFFTTTDVEQLRQLIHENAVSNYKFLSAPQTVRNTLSHRLSLAIGIASEIEPYRSDVILEDKSLRGTYDILVSSLHKFDNFYEYTYINMRKGTYFN